MYLLIKEELIMRTLREEIDMFIRENHFEGFSRKVLDRLETIPTLGAKNSNREYAEYFGVYARAVLATNSDTDTTVENRWFNFSKMNTERYCYMQDDEVFECASEAEKEALYLLNFIIPF